MRIVLSTQILFYYPVSDLVDKMRLHTGMASRTLKTEDRIDEYIYADDTDWLHRTAKKAFAEAYTYVWKLSTNLSEGLLLNRSIVAAEFETDVPPDVDTVPIAQQGILSYGFWVRNLQGHNTHSLLMIDNKIFDFVIEIMLREWWLKCGVQPLYTASSTALIPVTISYNNSLMDLYKVKLTLQNLTSYVEVEIDEDGVETDTETDEEIIPDTSGAYEILYFNTYSEFPVAGTADIVYVNRNTGDMYYWNGTSYVAYFAGEGEYELVYEDANYVVVPHGLGKFAPNVTVLDSNGDDFEVDIEYVDVDTLIVSWNTACSGKIICN